MSLGGTAVLMLVFRVDGFAEMVAVNNAYSTSAQPFPIKHNTSQFLAPRVVIKLPTKNDDAGNAIEEEVYSMEPKLNATDFLKAESIKMWDMSDEAMQWYRSIVTHGSVNGVFIPPLYSIVKGQSMGSYTEKRRSSVSLYTGVAPQ
jgi:hypothetical protein